MSMNPLSRRYAVSGIGAAVASFLLGSEVKAQFTEQEVLNDASIAATGNVTLTQDAAGSQVVTTINGQTVVPGIHREGGGIQVVGNDGSVAATGNVNVTQSASATQTVYSSFPEYAGQPADVCSPGDVLANPDTGQVFFQGRDCCWYPACAAKCQNCETCG